MRHLLALLPALAVGGLPGGMAEPATAALLVPLARRPAGRPPADVRTETGTVPLPAITAAAEEEQLPAVPSSADDEAE